MTTRIEIPLPSGQNAKLTIAKAQRLAARAQKKGLSGGWRVVDTETRWETDQYGIERTYKVLIIEGEPFTYEGWRFLAKAEWFEDQIILTTLPGCEDSGIDRSELVEGWCDHCQKNRRRSAVYIVESDDGRKQVGSSCLKDFTGHDISAALEKPFSPDDDLTGGFSLWIDRVPTVEALAVACRTVRTKGYCSKKNATDNKVSTANTVWDYLWGRTPYDEDTRQMIGKITPDDIAEAERLIEWVATEYTGRGDYAENLRAAAAIKMTESKTLGTLVSVFAAKGYADEREAERASENLTEDRYAADGEKITVEVDVATVRHLQGLYGPFAFVTFKSDTHRFKWKATGASIPEEGDRIVLTGTVKGIDEWNGAVYTVMTRCKFESVKAVCS